MGSFGMTFIGFIAVIFVLNVLRLMLAANSIHGGGSRKVARIADRDAHLSFDERIAERMRELERDKALAEPLDRPATPPASPLASPLATRDPGAARPSFGRRSL